MATYIIEINEKTQTGKKLLDFLMSLGFVKIAKSEKIKDEALNITTQKALKEADSHSLKKYSSVKTLMADLNK